VQLSISGSASSSTLDPELDLSVELPFAPEAGVGLAIGEQLFATGLRRDGRATLAMLARFGPEPEDVDLVELVRLHGDAAPPRLASDGGRLIIGVQEATPTGHELRIAQLEPAQMRTNLEWRAAPPQSKDDSNVFDLAASDGYVVVVWDEWVVEHRHGRISSAVFHTGPASAAEPLSAPGIDAEKPRISARPGGYWVAWLATVDARAGRVYDPGLADHVQETSPADERRALEIVALDSRGRRSGTPVRVTGPDDHVVGYDLTTSPTGSAWLVWRHDVPTAGASGGRISMGVVSADGAAETALLEADAIGAGEPSWLPAGADRAPWLTFADEADQTRLVRLQQPLSITESLALTGDATRAAAIGAAGDRILFAAARGTDVELFPARCDAPRPRTSGSRATTPTLAARPDASVPAAK
jgi:hypothetical protein